MGGGSSVEAVTAHGGRVGVSDQSPPAVGDSIQEV